jgi:hypothetical protein
MLHAGGKFEGGSAYASSGGSARRRRQGGERDEPPWLTATVRRGGLLFRQIVSRTAASRPDGV